MSKMQRSSDREPTTRQTEGTTIPRDNAVGTWKKWYQQNAHRFRYFAVPVDDKTGSSVYTIRLNGITSRIRFTLYTNGRGGDVYILDRNGEMWDFLLWLDAPEEDPSHDVVHDTFEPFRRWANALERVDQIHLVTTPDGGVKATRFVSPPVTDNSRETLVYNDKIQAFARTRTPESESFWQVCDEVVVHE